MSNDSTTMERQKSKFIYDFLPWNTFNHAHNNLSGRVMSIESERDDHGREQEPDLPENYVLSRIHRHVSKWPNADLIRDKLSAETVELVQPGAAGYHIYPRTFECSNCGSVNTYDEDDIEETADAGVDAADHAVCDGDWCDASLSDRDQLPFIAVCECGSIEELYAPTCCDAGMRFQRPTTQMADWYWECANPGCTNGDGGGRSQRSFFSTPVYCPNPDCDNEDMDVINHTDNSAYYAQVHNLINVQPALDNLHASDAYQARIVSDYLLHGTDVGVPDDHEIRDAAATILGGWDEYGDADPDERQKAEEDARDRLMVDVNAHRENIQRYLDTEYEYSPTRLAEELYEHLSLVDEEYEPVDGLFSRSYDEMLNDDDTDTYLSKPTLKEYINLRNDLNIDEVRIIKDFPITTVTYGYTRTASEPADEQRTPAQSNAVREGREGESDAGEGADEDDADSTERDVELNLFERGDYSAPQLYCQTNDAEAVFIQFNKEAVLDWLEENEVVSEDDMPDRDDEEAVRQWFIDTVRQPDRYESLPDSAPDGTPEKVSRYCYTLLNTTAHLFINAMGALAGHQRESLVEHLMPRTMSFVIYKRPDTSFALGSIWTLFEEQFDDFVSHIDELNDCSIDPVCRHDENGACEDCLYLAAISTENANHNLGRGTFYGGPFDGRDLTGFRDI